MQIYTRTGDTGTTKLMGGTTVSKNDPRVEAYGSIDELNSVVGVARSLATDWPELQAELQEIQQYLFDCGNDFATPEGVRAYRVSQAAIDWLESRVDEYAPQAPMVESFILPGGTLLASQLHVARTVTRRAERQCVTFIQEEAAFNANALKFLNRLSDYFFAVARLANARVGVEDILYKRSGKVFHTDITKDDLEK